MPGFWKRALSLLCAGAILLSCAGALAEFSPRYARMEKSGGMTARVSFQFENLSPLGESSLQAVNDWLSRAEFTLGTGESTLMEVLLDGESKFSISQRSQSGYTLTSFAPSGSAYLSDDSKGNILDVFSDGAWIIPNLSRLPDVYAQMSGALYAYLETLVETPKKVSERTSIKYAAASTAYVNYPLTQEQMNEAWPALLEILLPAMETVLSDQPVLYAQAESLLRAITFSGDCRFKRFLDKENGDMGLQFTGQAEKDGDTRKITLFGGWTPDKGGYISLSLPAVTGKNNWKGSLAVQLTEKNGLRTLTAEGAYARKLGDINVSGEMEATLKNQETEESEAWTGKVSVSCTENKEKTEWVIQPDLAFTDDGLRGTVKLQRKTDGKVSLKGAANLALTAGGPASASISGAKDLRGETAEKIQDAVIGELTPLAGVLADLFSELDETERTHLLHDLRTDAWMDGDM